MMDETRSRTPLDRSEAVGFCLQVAATNSALLTQHGSGKSGLHADLNPLAHAIRMNAVMDAPKAAARHVDAFAEITAHDIGQRLTTEQDVAKAEAVRTVGREIEALAQRAIGQTIAFAAFESLHVRLMDLGFALMPHHALDVASAIMAPDP